MINKYQDIINHEYCGSNKVNKISKLNRASQFAPFSALNGHQEAIYETGRLVEEKIELSEEEKIEISNILINYQKYDRLLITYYEKDFYKNGGKYLNKIAKIIKVDEYKKIITLDDNMKLAIIDIYKINLI